MNIWMIVAGIVLLLLFILLLWQYKHSQTMLNRVRDELKFFKKSKNYLDEVMLLLSKDYTVIYANQTAKDLFSLDENNEVQGIAKKIQLQLPGGMRGDFFSVLHTYSNTQNSSFKLENVLLFISGKEHKVSIFIDNTALKINETVTCIIDMMPKNSVVNVKEDSEKYGVDFLTGLPTQFQALAEINTLVVESKKKSELFGIFLLGIDHFSDIQSTLGLGYTNKILKRVAKYFLDNPDETMRVYRMDADKFLFVIEGLDEDELAKKIAKDVIVSVGNIFKGNNDIRLTSSIGVVFYPRDGENAAKLIDNAYRTLEKAHHGGDSNIEMFMQEDSLMHEDDVRMNQEIKQGLMKHEFLLFYQPIFDIVGEQIVGAEALLRWQHPKHGLISADTFLHVAEKTGLIVDLGEYAFNEAMKQRERFGVGARDDFQITINMSLREMNVEKFIPKLEMLFQKYNVETHAINLDVSEHDVMENIDKTANDFKFFKDLGLSLSLEHFGAGYSSFKYLNLLPLDFIKIDRSLIFDLALNLEHQTIVKAMIELAHTFGYKVIAEGVETSQEATILEGLKCDYAQGYLYSRPLPAQEFEALLK